LLPGPIHYKTPLTAAILRAAPAQLQPLAGVAGSRAGVPDE